MTAAAARRIMDSSQIAVVSEMIDNVRHCGDRDNPKSAKGVREGHILLKGSFRSLHSHNPSLGLTTRWSGHPDAGEYYHGLMIN